MNALSSHRCLPYQHPPAPAATQKSAGPAGVYPCPISSSRYHFAILSCFESSTSPQAARSGCAFILFCLCNVYRCFPGPGLPAHVQSRPNSLTCLHSSFSSRPIRFDAGTVAGFASWPWTTGRKLCRPSSLSIKADLGLIETSSSRSSSRIGAARARCAHVPAMQHEPVPSGCCLPGCAMYARLPQVEVNVLIKDII